ncbi:MAG: serine hydrolase [Ferruginibacter sp.]|nr:serine hydrolase [Ferruginibacter sp.]
MKFKYRNFLFFFIAATALPHLGSAQKFPDSLVKKIDSLFIKWDKKTSPGCTIGIVMNDQLVYSKGYGMANLEYDIPNTPGTIYHMASVSKQFTAWSILLLAQQGKLSLEDDVRKHLPWFPTLAKNKITIQHLLNHTSGIRDQWQLLAISGTRLDDVITQDHVVKLLSMQKALNFQPGEKYSYSNSGYTMLAEIVKSVMGQTLRKFSDSAIFKPLGMLNTHFHDDYTELVKNRSYSYGQADSATFNNAVLSYSVAGATSLFTNIPDMSKWIMSFYKAVNYNLNVDSLAKKGRLNSGKEINYANGISVGDYRGQRELAHSGGDAGYRTFLSVFPGLKMGFLVFSNFGEIDPGNLAHQLANFFIKDSSKNSTAKAPGKSKTSAADVLGYKKFTGSYIGEEGLPFTIEVSENKLHYQIYSQRGELVKEAGNKFLIADAPQISFSFSTSGKDTLLNIVTPDDELHLFKYVAMGKQADTSLSRFVGTYYSPELDCKYGIVFKDHGLLLTNSKYPDAKLTLLNNDHLTSENWWINHLKMLYDANKNVTGFEINSGRIMHLKFDRIKVE